MAEPRVQVAVFARAPVAGMAKTRLIPALGAQGAAQLQGWLLGQALASALASGVGPVSLWYAGALDVAQVTVPAGVAMRAQPHGDLGARMAAAIAASPAGESTLVMGSDCPALLPALVQAAAAVLRTQEVVLIPAEDGGYVLIGMRRLHAALFTGIAWGSGQVHAQTVARLGQLGLSWTALPALWDVDQPDDLPRLWQTFPEARGAVR